MYKNIVSKPEQCSTFEDRLRFQIEHNTSEWRDLKNKFELRRKSNRMYDAVLVCIEKMRKSTLPHFKYDPEQSDSYPLILIAPATTISQIHQYIREDIGITTQISLSIMQGSRLLVPSAKLSELPLAYDQLLFLNYTQNDPFG